MVSATRSFFKLRRSQKSFDVSAYKGQTIQVYLVGSEDSSAQTSFVVADFTLNVQ